MSEEFYNRGVVNVASPHSILETMDRLERIVRERGLTVFARIDQQAAAQPG